MLPREKKLTMTQRIFLLCRDSFCLCLLNSGTSFVSGFAIFSVLGYMSEKQGVDINTVAESGTNLNHVKL